MANQNTIADLSVTPASNLNVLGQSQQGTAPASTIDNIFQRYGAILARAYADMGGTGTVGGTANDITLTTASTYQALTNGLLVAFKATADNSAATTINVDTLGAKAIRAQGDTALAGGEIKNKGTYLLRYDTAYNTTGAWVLINAGGGSAATTSSQGIVELATVAEALAGTDAVRAVTPAGLYYPTGHLFGLTLTTNATDATNDIDIAAGTARDASDSFNYVVASAIGKQLDVAWALGGTPGATTGGLDTGSVGNNRYAIWGIGRSDTQVRNVLFSLSFTAPTMPTSYDYKVLLGEVTRTGGVNGAPLWYGPRRAATGYAGITLGSPTASTSGTSIDFTGIPSWVKRVTITFDGVSGNGSSIMIMQIGDSGGIENSGYLGTGGATSSGGTAAANQTTSFGMMGDNAPTYFHYGIATLCLMNQATNLWAFSSVLSAPAAPRYEIGAGSKSISPGPLDRVRIAFANGTDAFDAGNINIMYE